MEKLKILFLRTFLIAMCLCLSASLTGYAQNAEQKVSVEMRDGTLKELFKSIEKQTTYRISYRNALVDDTKNVTINQKNVVVSKVLEQALKGRNLTYVIVSPKSIVITEAKSNQAPAKKKMIKGVVKDQAGDPIIGANVRMADSNVGTITNVDGMFNIEVPDNAEMLVASVGYETYHFSAAKGNDFDITLSESNQYLDEVVAVGYGTQRKGNLTGSVSSIKSEQITVAPINSVSNALGGVLPGLVAKQECGMPGSDQASISIRGFGSPLVIVDGVESSMNNIDPSQIESISILKDGAASIYGARAGSGVVLITTKRGAVQKPTITYNGAFTLQGVANFTKAANSFQRATMERESHLNSGQDPATAPWTLEEIEHFRTGDDPLRYPDTDWYDVTFRDYAPQQNHNVSVNGGNERLKYVAYFGYNDQETMVHHDGGKYKRYNLQSNADAYITKDLKATVNMSYIWENRFFAIRGIGTGGFTWGDYYGTKPWFPASLPDPDKIAWGGIDVGSVYTTSNIEISGYSRSKTQDMKVSASLEYDFNKFVPGLKAKAFINFANYDAYGKSFEKPIAFYTYNYDTDTYYLAGSYNNKASSGENYSKSTTLTQQYSLNYDNTFDNAHHVTALALLELIDYNSNGFSAARVNFLTPLIDQLFAGSTEGMSTGGWASEMGRASIVGRLNYDYMGRYLIETILRADASAKFQKGSRWGYFPSVSAGWRISEEPWMRNLGLFDNLKLRASYGRSGNDAVGNFLYLEGYALCGYPYMLGGTGQTGLHSTGMANPYLSWERMTIYNGGLDFSMWNHKFYGTVEAFYRLRDGIPGTRITSLPSTFGASLPVLNLNSIDDRGFEFSVGTAGSLGDFRYDVSANISYSRAKWHYYEEPEYEDPDQARLYTATGNWTDRWVGYIADGLFTSQEEIDNLDYVYKDLGGNSTLRPGDVKLLDMNGDGVLDWKDQQVIGKGSTPHWMYGLSLNLTYRNFDLTGLFQGAFGYTTHVQDIFSWGTMTQTCYNLRWTPEHTNSDFPRLGGPGSNYWGSTYWAKDVHYIRLKNLAIGYNVPRAFLNKIGIQMARVYLAGTNLLTISNLGKYGVDPEVPSGNATHYYPQPRTFSLGLNLSF